MMIKKQCSETQNDIFDELKRKIIVTGHYGSGKTEFSVSLAMLHQVLTHIKPSQKKFLNCALIDLDIINPYFRSREMRELLQGSGVEIYGSAFDTEITAELPALGASIRAPLENNNYRVIIDTGGNDTGVLPLNQFSKYFKNDDTTVLIIINANRPDTDSIENAINHINAIEKVTGLTISYIVNNTHLLRETTADDIIKGNEFCKKIVDITSKKLLCDCYPDGIVDPDELKRLSGRLIPIGLYMRPVWMDI